MKYIKFISKTVLILTVCVAIAAACSNDERFHEEMYKKVFSLLGDKDNVYMAVHSFENEVSDGFISIYCGGTNPVEEDVIVELEYNDTIINTYNYRYFDLDSARYAKKMDKSRYDILVWSATMKAGQTDPYVTIPLKIYTQGISPDSIYFIPLKIKNISGKYEVNPDMASVMYRPVVENKYAQTSVATTYQSRGERNGKEIVSTKTMYPLTANKSRITVDTQTGLVDNIADLTLINMYGIILTVDESNNRVDISPYGTLQVEMLGDPNDNRYEITDFKRFYLHYRYRTLKTPATETSEAVYNNWFEIEEVLKRQN
jgi:hypothetical protein